MNNVVAAIVVDIVFVARATDDGNIGPGGQGTSKQRDQALGD